jgi:branched-chain amino acid transport system substrate-binding protein
MDQDKAVAIIGPSWSAAGIPLAEIADTAQVPMVATTASNVNVTVTEDGKLHPYMFRVCFIDPYQGYALADFAYNKLGLRKVAFLTDVASPYTVGVHKFFESHFTELGGEVVAQEGYTQGDTEFRAQLAKIKDSGADLLVSAATHPSLRNSTPALRKHTTSKPMFTLTMVLTLFMPLNMPSGPPWKKASQLPRLYAMRWRT